MKSKTLPVHSRLRSMQAAARFAPGGQRILAEAGTPAPLVALLREVNETILGRNLMFSSDAGTGLGLDVAGRRVLRVTAATGVPGAESCLAAAALQDAQRDDLARLLTAFAGQISGLRVLSTPLARGGDGLSVGLPVARLAEHLAIDLSRDDEVPQVEPVSAPVPVAAPFAATGGFLDSFVARMGDGLVAWLIHADGAPAARSGPEEMLSHLEEFLTEEFEALARQLDQVTLARDGPVCTVLGESLLAGHGILCVRAEGSVLLGVVAGDAAGPVLAAWNAARG